MRLTKLFVDNFLPYEKASLELPPAGLVLLAGANNAGKTSLLRAFDVLRVDEPTPGLRHRLSERSASVQAHFELSAEERDELVLSFDASEHLLDWFRAKGSWLRIWLTWSELPGQKLALTGINGEHGAHNHAIGRVTVTGSGTRLHWASLQGIDPDRGVPDTLPLPVAVEGGVQSDFFLRLTQAEGLAKPLTAWREDLYHLGAARSPGARQRPLGSATRLFPDGTNLAEVLDTLRTHPRNTGRWDAITRALDRILPGLGSLQTRTESGDLAVGVLDAALDDLIPLDDLGSGVAQVLFALVAGLHGSKGGVILIEEPEIHLHPGAQRELLDVLLELSEDRLFVVTTHSPVLLDQFDHPRVQVHVVTRDGARSTITSPSDPAAAALRALGVRPSDILDAASIVVVEGPSDQAALRHWYRGTLGARGVRVIEAQGGDAAWHTSNVEKLLSAAHAVPRRVVFIRDRDELSDDDVRRLEGTGCVLVLDRRELENFFLDEPDGVAAVLSERTGRPVLPDDVAGGMRSAADALQQAVICKRVANNVLGPLRVIDRRRLREIVAEGASPEALIRAATSALPPDLATAIKTEWEAEQERLLEGWDANWSRYAPGEEVLAAVWSDHGVAYQKTRDALLLAQHVTPPADLGRRIANLLDSGSNDL